MDRTRVAATAAAVLAAGLALGFGLGACNDEEPSSAPTSTTTSASQSQTPSESPSATGSTVPAPLLAGRLMFSQFDESVHTFHDTFVQRTDGSHRAVLPLPGPEGGGRWSPDGRLIAVMTERADGRIGTAIITADGTVKRLLDIPDPTLNLVCTTWSPDARRLACEAWDDSDPARSGIYTVRASDGGDLVRLTTSPAGQNDVPGDFSPDGSELVFKRSEGELPGPLMLVPADGGRPHRLSGRPVEDGGMFSPGGRQVLTSSGGELLVFDLDGMPVRTISEEGAFLFGAVWSPDGASIGYSRTTSGPFSDIWISRPDGSGAHQVTATPENEIALDWGA